MRVRISLFIFVASVALLSCGTNGNHREMAYDEAVSADKIAFQQQPASDKIEVPQERKIIKKGEIRFETSDIRESDSFIRKTVAEVDGYFATDDAYSDEIRLTHRMIIRLPATRFDEFLRKISETVGEFESRNINVEDVTEEYIDVETRIKTKKEIENRYRELLAQAKSVEDILAIEKEIGTIRTEIESVEGRLKYLKDQVGMSTLTVEFYQRTRSSFGFASKLGRAMVTGWDWLLAFTIGLIHLWPFILVAGIVLFIVQRSARKRKNKKTG